MELSCEHGRTGMKRDFKETIMVIALGVCAFAQGILTLWLTLRS